MGLSDTEVDKQVCTFCLFIIFWIPMAISLHHFYTVDKSRSSEQAGFCQLHCCQVSTVCNHVLLSFAAF